MSRVVVAGSFDSKARPLGLLIDALRSQGEDPLVIDVGVYPGDPWVAFPAEAVAARAGAAHEDLPSLGRAEAVATMARGAASILRDLMTAGDVGALVCMGGSNAATVFAGLAPVLPLGIPKILMATAVAGDTRPIMGAEDVILLYPVVDVDGDNPILREMIARLATTAAAVRTDCKLADMPRTRKTVALTMYGVTTPCLQRVSKRLEDSGAEAIVFHANGTGGRSVEAFARQGLVDGIVDATLAELGNELLGGAFPAGPDRMQAAAQMGVPQVIAPGAIDMIAFGPRATVPERFEDHKIHAHNAIVTLVRTTPEECHAIGVRLAERLSAPKAPCTLCIPMGGTSMLDQPEGIFFHPEAVAAFRDGFTATADRSIRVIASDHNLNHPKFADLLFDELKRVMAT